MFLLKGFGKEYVMIRKIYLLVAILLFSSVVIADTVILPDSKQVAEGNCVGDDLWCNQPKCTPGDVWCEGNRDKGDGSLAITCATFFSKADRSFANYISTGVRLKKLTQAQVNTETRKYKSKQNAARNELVKLSKAKQTETCRALLNKI